MQKWERALLRMTVASQAAFAWLIAADVGMLPANLRGDGVLFRWQVWLLASLVLVASRDFVSQIRCHRCGSREQVSLLGLLPLRHLLCRSCLSWDSGTLLWTHPSSPLWRSKFQVRRKEPHHE